MDMHAQLMLNPLWDFLFAFLILATGLLYWSENRRQKVISAVRQLLFYLGLALIFILLVGPIAHKAVNVFWIHMIQHIMLMMLISPLLVLGSPVKLFLNSRKTWLQKPLQKLSENFLVRQLFRAQVGFVLFLTVLIVTHFSPLANAGMMNSNIHVVELILFLIGGFIYYYSVMEGNPQPYPTPYSHRVISLFAMMFPETMVGFFLCSGNRLLHSLPHFMNNSMGLSDQHRGGAIMWAMGMLIDSMWIVLATRDWFENEKRLGEDENDLIRTTT